ncbi:MAG TPA: VOC family protein, partial [Chloroflexota bacterium]
MTTPTTGIPTKLGHVAIRVRDLDRAVEFYRDVVGLPLRSRHADVVAFLGAREDASHEIALFALPADAPPPEPGRVGMYHMAWEMASFEDLRTFHARLLAHHARITGYSDR